MAFTSQFYSSTYVPSELLKVNGEIILNLSGYDVEEYDLSKDAGRNALGDMKLSYLGKKYKIIFRCRPQNQEELAALFAKIPMEQLSVYFFNPYTNTYETRQCYRGDRKVTMLSDRQYLGKLFDSTEMSLIEL